jgi:hypothetical protein
LLDNLRKIFHELGGKSMMKETLRSIYDLVKMIHRLRRQKNGGEGGIRTLGWITPTQV